MKLLKLALVALLIVPLSGCIFSVGGGCSHSKRLDRIEKRLDGIEKKLDIPPPPKEPPGPEME